MKTGAVEQSDETLLNNARESLNVRTIGRYEILSTLGRGNMGEVFRARDPMIGRMVALKTRRFDLVYEQKDIKFVTDRFFEEARIAGNLVHPNIVTIFDVGRDGDYCFMAMELLEGENLTSVQQRRSAAPTTQGRGSGKESLSRFGFRPFQQCYPPGYQTGQSYVHSRWKDQDNGLRNCHGGSAGSLK